MNIPKDAGRELISESLAAASYARLSMENPVLADAARKAVASNTGTITNFFAHFIKSPYTAELLDAAFEGSRAYVRGDGKAFNEFSIALKDRFGPMSFL